MSTKLKLRTDFIGHATGMRTTINLDTDAYDLRLFVCAWQGMTVGAAISEHLRKAERTPEREASGSGRLVMNEYGYYKIAGRGDVITVEMAKELSG
jgi:hypothetical protein